MAKCCMSVMNVCAAINQFKSNGIVAQSRRDEPWGVMSVKRPARRTARASTQGCWVEWLEGRHARPSPPLAVEASKPLPRFKTWPPPTPRARVGRAGQLNSPLCPRPPTTGERAPGNPAATALACASVMRHFRAKDWTSTAEWAWPSRLRLVGSRAISALTHGAGG